MSETNAPQVGGTPKHLWVVGILALAWNAMGAFDYYMSQTQNAEYMSQFSPELLDFFYGLPIWAVSAWAIAVWGGVLGTLLLLLRKRLAVTVYFISLIALVASMIHTYVLSDGLEVMGDAGSLAFTAAIFVIAGLLWVYAGKLSKGGVLS